MAYLSENIKRVVIFDPADETNRSVILALLERENEFAPRCVTLDLNSDLAVDLKALGASVVQGDLASMDDLRRVLKQAYGVFLHLPSWTFEDPRQELELAKNVLIVSKEADVKIKCLIHSSLPPTAIGAPMESADIKHEIDRFAFDITMPYIALEAGLYLQHFLASLRPSEEAGEYVFRMAISPDAKIPFIDKDDVGQVVASMFSNPTKYLRQRVQIAGDVASMREVAEIFSRVTGKHARFEEIPRVQLANLTPKEEHLAQLYNLFAAKPPSVNLGDMRKLYPKIKTVEEFFRLNIAHFA